MKMNYLKSFCIYSVFVSFLHLSECASNEWISRAKAFDKMLQDRVSCFMVNTAAKLHRTNVENKLYNKNIIFSPVELFVATALVHRGSYYKDVILRQKLNTILGIPTYEKFIEQYPTLLQTSEKTIIKSLSKRGKKLLASGDKYFANETVGFPPDIYDDMVANALGKLYQDSLNVKDNSVVRSGLGIFIDRKYKPRRVFFAVARNNYGVDVERMKFEKEPELSTEKINKFIKKRTYDRITEFFNEPLAKTTKCVLTTSLVTFANWRFRFSPKNTYETAFHTRCDDCDNVDICVMSSQGGIIPYYSDSEVTAISLPVSQYRMYYVVPRANQSLSQIISNPNKNFFTKIIDGCKRRRVDYAIPKMTYRGEVDMWDIIGETGLTNETTRLNDIAYDLTLSIFKHKIELEVNEDGIGGCPITDLKPAEAQEPWSRNEPVQFAVDRPFIFFLYDESTKMFLFYGAVFKPTGYMDS